MTYSQLLSALQTTGLSPEQLAPLLGVSNMTIRRWRDRPGTKMVPRAQALTVTEGLSALVREGLLDENDVAVRSLLADSPHRTLAKSLGGMGISLAELRQAETGPGSDQARMTGLLHRIGKSKTRQKKVDAAQKQLLSMRRLGRDWKRMLELLLATIRAPRSTAVQRLVAYGALFYVIYPFDLIPDHIPLLGLTDDFAVVALAASFITTRGTGAQA